MHGWRCPKSSHGGLIHGCGSPKIPPLSPPPIGVRHGNAEWREFLVASQMCYWRAAALMDLHNVVDTFNWQEAARVGVDIDHHDHLGGYLLSYGRNDREQAFDPDEPYTPLMTELNGKIFTDYGVGCRKTVDIYREPWMKPDTIGVKGDKGQVAQLLGIPCLLFDDRKEHIDLVRARSSIACKLEGIQVLRGRRAGDKPTRGCVPVHSVDDIILHIYMLDQGFVCVADGFGGCKFTDIFL